MKLSKLVIISLVFVGCQSPYTHIKKVIDDRPATELSLIKKLAIADSVYGAQENDIRKQDALESGKKGITKFIVDTLQLKANQWNAIVEEIKVDEILDYVDVTLIISKHTNLDPDDKYPEFHNIILVAHVPGSDTTVKNTLRDLLKGDNVLVSGTFEKDAEGEVDLNAAADNFDSTFSNATFHFNINSIVKSAKKTDNLVGLAIIG